MKDFLDRFLHNKLAVLGGIILLTFVLIAIFADVIAPWDPYSSDGSAILHPPCAEHPLGTDNLGRDILSRIIYGARISLRVSCISVTVATVLGLLLGVLAGYFGGMLDSCLSRLTDVMFALPEVLLALVIMTILGTNVNNVIIAIGIVYTPIFARISRGAVLSIRQSLFIEASRSIGISNRDMILRHIVPNILPPVIVQITLSLAFAILAEASLSYLGIGCQPDVPSWGNLLNSGKTWMELAWWVATFPGIAISIVVLGFNILGDGLRDVLDPKLRNVRN